MGLEVGLPLQVGHPVQSHVVVNQRDRFNQGDESTTVLPDQAHEFSPRRRIQPFLEMADDLLEDLRISASRRDLRECAHELSFVPGSQLHAGCPFRVGDEAAQSLVGLGRMREQREFVGGVKGREPGQSPAAGEEGTKPAVGEDSSNEILAQTGVPEAPLPA
jgi:hypothetical protein